MSRKLAFNRHLTWSRGWILRIAQRVEQRLAQEREYWRCHVVDLIAAERERLVALVEEEHNKVFELFKADHEEVFDWVHRMLEQSASQAMKGFDQLEAKLDQFAALRVRLSDDGGQPPPATH